MKNLFILCILIFAAVACKKRHTLHIKAINPVTGLPYAGLDYSIKGTKSAFSGEKLAFSYSGTLDENGEAFPTIKVNENLTLHVGCTKPPNNCYVKDVNFFWDAKVNPSPTFQFEYAECATMQRKEHQLHKCK